MAEFSTRKITPADAVKIPAVNENLANPSGYMEADEFKSWAINGLAAQADVDGIRGSDDAYSSSSTYAVGDYAIYENVLYRCKTAVTTAEDFDSSKWDAVDLKSNREAITSLSVRGGYYAFVDSKTVTTGAGAAVTFDSNLPIGTYLLLVQSDSNISDSSIMSLDMAAVSGMTLVIGGGVRGTMNSGGGLVNFGIITVTSATNSFAVGGYGYCSSSYTQRFRAYCIRLT